MGDRAQYFLEQSVPELLDLQEKKIFSPLEIKAITRKRILHEQALTRKIVRKADFLRYAEYEINLEALRVQRVKRLQLQGKRSISDYAGPRRIFFIFERATRRFHGDVKLWLQYIEYAKRQKSNKVLGKVYTSALQYHPTNSVLWSLAAQHEASWNGNLTAARRLMQRGLRLNSKSVQLWTDYFRLEVEYLDKVYARRKVLGLDKALGNGDLTDNLITGLDDQQSPAQDEFLIATSDAEEDVIDLSDDDDMKRAETSGDLDMSTLISSSSSNVALEGAIPIAIMKAALRALPKDLTIIIQFHQIMSEFDHLPFHETVLNSIMSVLTAEALEADPLAVFIRVTLPMSRLRNNVKDAAFPEAFKKSLHNYTSAHLDAKASVALVKLWTRYLQDLLVRPDLDPNLKQAILLTIRKAFKSVDVPQTMYGEYIDFERRHGKHSDDITKEAKAKFPGIEHFEIQA